MDVPGLSKRYVTPYALWYTLDEEHLSFVADGPTVCPFYGVAFPSTSLTQQIPNAARERKQSVAAFHAFAKVPKEIHNKRNIEHS
jgi:hypothetical protein